MNITMNRKENEIATEMKVGAVEGGAERISPETDPGSTDVSAHCVRDEDASKN